MEKHEDANAENARRKRANAFLMAKRTHVGSADE